MIQQQFISYIINNRDMSLITLNNITSDYFSEYEEEFSYIQKHYDTYGTTPDRETFLSKFSDFILINVNESPRYLVDSLQEEYLYLKSLNVFESVNKIMLEGDSRRGVELLLSKIPDLTEKLNVEAVDILHDGADTRFNEYCEKGNEPQKYYVKTGLPELDEKIGGWNKRNDLVTICGRPGTGKCLVKGTEVIMHNGSLKKVEDIVAGDRVKSENGDNTVLETHSGIADCYTIYQENYESFTVTDNHILTLIKKENEEHTMVDMCVSDFVKLPDIEKALYYLPHPITKYRGEAHYENMQAVGSYIKLLNKKGVKLISEYANACDACICADIDTRKSFLYALADTTFMNDLCIKIRVLCEREFELIDKIIRIARSVGYVVTTALENKNVIAVKCTEYLDYRYPLSKFYVRKAERQKYYGFGCDGDHRFLLRDNTLTHNSWWMDFFLYKAAEAGATVALYSGEMDESQVGYRIDTFSSHLSNFKITRGFSDIFDEYQKHIQELQKLPGKLLVCTPRTLGGVATVPKLKAFCERYHVDILGVDQYSLLADIKNSRARNEKFEQISMDLKNMQIQLGIPVLINAQLNRGAMENGVEEAGTEHLAGSDRISQDSSIIITVVRRTQQRVALHLIKVRDAGTGGKLVYEWDIDKGNLRYISENENESAEPQQQSESANTTPEQPRKRRANREPQRQTTYAEGEDIDF